jgi:hypothetical protein
MLLLKRLNLSKTISSGKCVDMYIRYNIKIQVSLNIRPEMATVFIVQSSKKRIMLFALKSEI